MLQTARMGNEDLRKAEEFVQLMRTHLHSLWTAKKFQPVARYCPFFRNCENITLCRQMTQHLSVEHLEWSFQTLPDTVTDMSRLITIWKLIIYTNGYLLSVTFSPKLVFVPHFQLKDGDIQAFLEEATVLDPGFKSKMDMDDIWGRVRASAVAANTEAVEKVLYLNLTMPLAHFCCETFSSCSVVLTVHFFSSCQSQERHRGRQKKRMKKKKKKRRTT